MTQLLLFVGVAGIVAASACLIHPAYQENPPYLARHPAADAGDGGD